MLFRFEEKVKLDRKKTFFFKKWLNVNQAQNIYPDREVYSIYFDNKDFQTHQDSIEGVVPRKKIRLRTYNFSNKDINNFNLEIKTTLPFGRLKNTRILKKNKDLLRHGILLKDYGWCYPKIVVKYTRSYYILEKIRVTLDTKISFKKFTHKNYGTIFFDDFDLIVAELKADSLSHIDDIKYNFQFEKTRFSKYCYGIEALYDI
tara:strand:+ start:2979 stop:3587 length:609 start_codon:yes stop_codon:yes gene_type:complete